MAYGLGGGAPVTLHSGTASLRGSAVMPGTGDLYTAAAVAGGIARFFTGPTLPTTTQAVTLASAQQFATTTGFTSYGTGVYFSSSTELWVGNYYGGSTASCLYFFQLVAGTWTLATGFPKASSNFVYTHPTVGAVTPCA